MFYPKPYSIYLGGTIGCGGVSKPGACVVNGQEN